MGEKRHRRQALIRLSFIVEGQTEEGFVKRVIGPALEPFDIFTSVQIVQTSRKRGVKHKGGLAAYEKLRTDILLRMKGDRSRDHRFTTMVDYYGLPTDFPGHSNCQRRSSALERVLCLEAQMKLDIIGQMGNQQGGDRFIPYIQLHEFEALLFSEIEKLATSFPDSAREIAHLDAIRNTFSCPEEIDGGTSTHPSKRLLDALPGYDKRVHGAQTTQQIGLAAIQNACPHFNFWIESLEKLGR